MRKKLAALVAATALTVVSASPASAATRTVGWGCRLSANWYVNFSATLYDGDLAYMVITSPGPLFYGTGSTANTYAYAFGPGAGTPDEAAFGRVGTGTNPYTYRSNHPRVVKPTTVAIRADSSPSHVACYAEKNL